MLLTYLYLGCYFIRQCQEGKDQKGQYCISTFRKVLKKKNQNSRLQSHFLSYSQQMEIFHFLWDKMKTKKSCISVVSPASSETYYFFKKKNIKGRLFKNNYFHATEKKIHLQAQSTQLHSSPLLVIIVTYSSCLSFSRVSTSQHFSSWNSLISISSLSFSPSLNLTVRTHLRSTQDAQGPNRDQQGKNLTACLNLKFFPHKTHLEREEIEDPKLKD